MALEEMSELSNCLCKHVRGRGSLEDIVEEIADVEIMLEQLKVMFEVNTLEIDAYRERKLRRLEGMLYEMFELTVEAE